MRDYVSLHNHTSFSIMDALMKPSALFKRAKELGQKAVAVTDHGTLAGMWDCLKASKEVGIKCIAGCEMYFVNDVNNDGEQLRHIVVLAKNATGYKNLLLLNKAGYDNFIVSFGKAIPRIDWKLLEKYSEGLICTTACGNGILSQLIMQKDFVGLTKQAKMLKDIFGDNLALELQPHALTRRATNYSGEIDQRFVNLQLTKLSEELNIRAIVATDAHYQNKEHHKAHDVLLAIGSKQPIGSGARLTYNTPDFYVKSADEVEQYFTRLKGLWKPEFIDSLFENTIYFADQCEDPDWIDPKFSNPSGKELPTFPVQDQDDYEVFKKYVKENDLGNLDEDVVYLRYLCELGLQKKAPKGQEQLYRERLNEELEVMEYHSFSSYMLIVADILSYARKNNIRVGPGRGSVGGSIIGYFLDIHIADPIKYKLIFARFHNKEKSSFPDVDLDISPAGRTDIQNYIKRKYGDEYVASVSNINTITPKVYVRDIARSFEFGNNGRSESAKIGDAIADAIPKEVHSITSAVAEDKIPLFSEYAKEYPELLEFAPLIAGKARAWSTHAGGMIIGKRPLTGLVPLRRDKEGLVVLEYNKDRAEDSGLVKMDLLGIETLNIISNTHKIIEERGKEPPPEFPPLDDEKTYDLIGEGNTFCVFQLSSTAVGLCRAIKPKSIEEISYINALIRPSAKAIVQDFLDTRDGKKEVSLLHPSLKRAFENTYGFGLYEECLLYLAQDVAGWDLHSADRLRKLTKEKGKNPKKVKKWRTEFIDDAEKNGIERDIATKIWDEVIDGFQGYGFNASHSIFYSLNGYHTAYLKANYPLEFLVANLMKEVNSGAKQAKDNILRIKSEIRALGVNIVPPDINTSGTSYKIIDDKTLMTGLDSLKFMGKDAIPEILAQRPFNSFQDFLTKVDSRKVSARAIQAMAASGCLDSFELSRRQIFYYAGDYKKKLHVWLRKSVEKRTETFDYPWPEDDKKDWSPKDKYALEEYYLGEGMSGSLDERFEGFFSGNVMNFAKFPERFTFIKLEPKKPLVTDDLRKAHEKAERKKNTYNVFDHNLPTVKGIVTNIFAFKVKKENSPILGQTMARITLQDKWGNDLSVVAFPSGYDFLLHRVKAQSGGKAKLEVGMALAIAGSFQYESEHVYSFIFDDILSYKAPPSLPEDLKARKVRMPRVKKQKNIEQLNLDELSNELDDALTEDGISDVEEDDFPDPWM